MPGILYAPDLNYNEFREGEVFSIMRYSTSRARYR